VGNRDLLPETTNQYNIGITYQRAITKYVPLLSVACDVYHNDVRNKIVAYPTKNIYTWTMLNYGRVSITGLDFTGDLEVAPHPDLTITLGATYTYNRALNVTNPSDRDYRHQIPYTPRISGSGKAGLKTPWFSINYSLVWSGHRYAVNQNYKENRVEGYFDHSLSASHEFNIKNEHKIGVNIECLNLTNVNYCVVRYFPMPGRSWRGTLYWKF
jgi:outer membrane cobalamin receptor